jgi:hypothetical protein
VSSWGEARPTFDAENLSIETTDAQGSEVNDEDDVPPKDPGPNTAQVNSSDDLYNLYK